MTFEEVAVPFLVAQIAAARRGRSGRPGFETFDLRVLDAEEVVADQPMLSVRCFCASGPMVMVNLPTPLTPPEITSPGRTVDTPAGVPAKIRSPGLMATNSEAYETIFLVGPDHVGRVALLPEWPVDDEPDAAGPRPPGRTMLVTSGAGWSKAPMGGGGFWPRSAGHGR
jgi:hypothetical protein